MKNYCQIKLSFPGLGTSMARQTKRSIIIWHGKKQKPLTLWLLNSFRFIIIYTKLIFSYSFAIHWKYKDFETEIMLLLWQVLLASEQIYQSFTSLPCPKSKRKKASKYTITKAVYLNIHEIICRCITDAETDYHNRSADIDDIDARLQRIQEMMKNGI